MTNDQGQMTNKAFQDYYTEDTSHCYGCGRLNEHGLQIKSYWDGDEAVCTYQPREYHTAIPGYVYGGLIASLIDCHSTGTAAAAAAKAMGIHLDDEAANFRFLTGSLHVDYLKPTPIRGALTIRAQVKEIKGRKVTVISSLYANDVLCAKGEVVAIQVPAAQLAKLIENG